jgi:hypothetical protein
VATAAVGGKSQSARPRRTFALLQQLHQESDPGSFLPIERQVDEGWDAYQVEALGRDVTTRDSDRLNGLVDGGSPDRMKFDTALSPDDSEMAPATKTGLEVAATLSTSFGRLPSPVIVRKSSSSLFSTMRCLELSIYK